MSMTICLILPSLLLVIISQRQFWGCWDFISDKSQSGCLKAPFRCYQGPNKCAFVRIFFFIFLRATASLRFSHLLLCNSTGRIPMFFPFISRSAFAQSEGSPKLTKTVPTRFMRKFISNDFGSLKWWKQAWIMSQYFVRNLVAQATTK